MTVYKNLAKFVEEVSGKEGLLRIKYTKPDYQDPKKEFTVGNWEKNLSEETLEKFVDLEPGKEFCIHVEKNDKGFMDLKDITDASDAPKRAQQKSKYSDNKGGYAKKDDSGATVGNALNVAAITLGAGSTLKEIEERAAGVLEIGEKLRQKLKGTQAGSTDAEKKPTSKLEEMRKKKAAKSKKASAKKAETVDESELEELVDDELEDWE